MKPGAFQPTSRSNLALILQNKFYTGYFEWKDVEYKGNHEALVDLETYEKVQEILLINRCGTKRRTYNHFLKGSVYCSDCGRKLSINAIKKKDKKYLFYYCLESIPFLVETSMAHLYYRLH